MTPRTRAPRPQAPDLFNSAEAPTITLGAAARSPDEGEFVEVSIAILDPSPLDPRLDRGEALVQQIATGLRDLGYFPREHAVIVRPKPCERFEIISGHRRVRGARVAGLATVWAHVVRWSDERVASEVAYANVQTGLSRWEVVRHSFAIERSQGQAGEGLDAYARRFSLNPESLRRYRRGAALVANLPSPDVRGSDVGKVLEHLCELSRIPQGDEREAAVARLLSSKWSLREVRAFVSERLGEAAAPVSPPELPSMTARLIETDGTDGERVAVIGVKNQLLNVSLTGDEVTVRPLGRLEPAVLGGPDEDRTLNDRRSYEAAVETINEFPAEVRRLMQLIEEPSSDERVTRIIEIQVGGDVAQGAVRLSWWKSRHDWWMAHGCGDAPATEMLRHPCVHITSQRATFDETVEFESIRPWNTVRALKAKIQEAVLRELGPTHGVHADHNQWLDRDGVPLSLARRRADADPSRGDQDLYRGGVLRGVVTFPSADSMAAFNVRKPTKVQQTILKRIVPHEDITSVIPMPSAVGVDAVTFWVGMETGPLIRGLLRLPPAKAAHLAREVGFDVRDPLDLSWEEPDERRAGRPFAVAYGAEGRFRSLAIGWFDTAGRTAEVLSLIPCDEPFVVRHSVAAFAGGAAGHPLQAWIGEAGAFHTPNWLRPAA